MQLVVLCIVVCVCCLNFRNHSDLCSAPSNVRTADSFDKGRFPWSQVTCTPVAHEGYLVRGEILATQKSYDKDNPKNVLTFSPPNRRMLRRSRCVLIFLLKLIEKMIQSKHYQTPSAELRQQGDNKTATLPPLNV